MARQTKLAKWVAIASEEQWQKVRADRENMSDQTFKQTYGFSRSGIKRYLDEIDGIRNEGYESIVYREPSGYRKITIQLSEEAYEELIQMRDKLKKTYGMSANYLNSVIIEEGCKSCQKHLRKSNV